MYNPIAEGMKITTGLDLFADGFTGDDLDVVYYDLTSDPEQEALLMESASIHDIDAHYNPGELLEMIFESIKIQRFSQTDSKMKALIRVLNRSGDGITAAEEPIIGKPRKSGLFATVTVQIPLSDGQVLSIIFHSPSGDDKKILADDVIIAFRWLLNKRDITHAVSPEKGQSISLEKIAKRVMQIVSKNSDAFQKKQFEVKAQKAELEDVTKSVEGKKARKHEVSGFIADLSEEAQDLDDSVAILESRIEDTRKRNADLEVAIAAYRKRADERKKLNDIAGNTRRLQNLGTEKVPGVRLADAEATGSLWEMLQKGELTQEEWDKHVEELYKSGAAKKPEVEDDHGEAVPILPAKDQKGNPAKRAAKILHALNSADKAMEDGFHLKLKNGEYQDLSIETHDSEYIDKHDGARRVYFTQYVKGGQDSTIDSEMVFETNRYTGYLKLVEIGYRGPMGEVRRDSIGRAETSWANMFSKKLIDHGYEMSTEEGKGDGAAAVKTDDGTKILEVLKTDDGEAEIHVAQISTGFSVVMKDIDSGEFLDFGTVYKNEQDAMDYAQGLLSKYDKQNHDGKGNEPDMDEETLQIAEHLLDGMYDGMPIDEVSNMIEPIFDLDEKKYFDLMERVDAYATALTKKKAQASA